HARGAGQPGWAVTITGLRRRVRIAAREEAQQQLVDVIGREQPLGIERRRMPVRLDVRERAEIASARPRKPERRERLQQRAPPLRTRAARDETDAPVPFRQRLDQLTRVPVRALMEHEAALEMDRLALAHDQTSKPSRFSSRSL